MVTGTAGNIIVIKIADHLNEHYKAIYLSGSVGISTDCKPTVFS